MQGTEIGTSYLDSLNDIQKQAVTTLNGPVMVIAGPGSGKTRVLTYRIAHLLKSGVPPYQILALTFTNKAAREMKDRIEKVAGPDAYKVWAGTFHSIFARILRVEAHRIGYPNDFSIYDTDDSKSVIKEIIKSLSLDTKVYNVGAIRARISSAKSNLITPKMYAGNEECMEQDKMNRRPMTFKIYERYVAKCKRAGAMDFDDLLLQMFRLLYQNPDNIRSKYQNQFKFLMVDEFQDTNFLQYEILKLFAIYDGSAQNVCIVGDDAQSIYSFRGATIENILQFETDFPDVRTFKLEQNYRSTHFIVKAANEVITYNKRQIKKEIWTERDEGQKIKVIKGMTDSEEGKMIADAIIEQKNRFSLANKNIAILYRTNAQSRVFEEHLRRSNIAYKIYGGLSFYQRKEIKDVIAYLRLATNTRDDEALKRVINFPKRGIGATTITNLTILANDNEVSMWQCLNMIDFKPRAKQSVGKFVSIVKASQQKAQTEDAYKTAMFIVKRSGIIDLLKAENSIEAQNRLENINALLDGIQEFVEDDVLDEGEDINGQERTLSNFLQTISLMTDQDENKDNVDTVTLLSVHAAKGLEFKSVFVVGLEENLFPSYMSLSSPDQLDEERRLFYVAITRAEEYLTLSYANSRYQYGQMRYNDPSRFLEEISDDNIDANISFNQKPKFGTPKILGKFKPLGAAKPKALTIDPKDFTPNNSSEIKPGQTVLHMKFGQGKVLSIDERKVATIRFANLHDNAEKRIMLEYARLQIVEEI
ncbi:MAG: UvrD-helicase domain-containing protein [Saprospiraceae bacterium]|nr:UvrD-helicase domain-containing protein [Bacteroidia bacterium]NNL92456.1 UvrD-helicase domain-containing protein [Saprospiraceae bacterium]